MTRPHTPRLLLSAYQCGPGMGSVSQIGWHWYQRLARAVPTTLLTHARNRPAIEQAGGAVGDSHIHYVDTEWFAGPLYRMAARVFRHSEHAVFLVSSLDFYVYDGAALRLARRLRREGHAWDIVHAPTPVSPLAATRLYRLGLPVVLGPWNGNLGLPSGFRDILRADSAWLYPVRHFGRVVDMVVGGTRHATAILTATRATLEGIPARHRRLCVPMLENGVDLTRFRDSEWPAPAGIGGQPLRLLFTGRLVPFKGVAMLIDAVARIRGEFPVQLRIVGDGPLAQELEDQVRRLDLTTVVSFAGNQPPDVVAAEMRDTHVFCLPSVRESGGAVLLEAMASARPVIAVAFGGPAEIVDDEVGLALPANDAPSVIEGMAAAFRDVVRNPDAWRQRGIAGRRRAEGQYGWDAKIESAIRLYQGLLEDPLAERGRRQARAPDSGGESRERP
jgi:glycosyltransferase involved in cell wall biosynthesis